MAETNQPWLVLGSHPTFVAALPRIVHAVPWPRHVLGPRFAWKNVLHNLARRIVGANARKIKQLNGAVMG